MIDLAEFARALRAAAPSREALLGLGMSQDAATDFISSFELPARPEPVPVAIDGTFRVFFGDFDPSKVEIGMVRFPDPPYRIGKSWVVGLVEADPLVFDPMSGALHVEDHATPGHVVWSCAASPDEFLHALLQASSVLGSRSVEEVSEDPAAAIAACTAAAGGEAYGNFYRMLLSTD